MNKIIKRFFCKHEWSYGTVRTNGLLMPNGEVQGGELSELAICSKCGKSKMENE